METIASQKTKRLISLDALRGLTIIGMILVNTPGSWTYVYPPLRHAEWNGLTPTDLVFPFFLFVVGVSIVLAYTKRLDSGFPQNNMVKKILWRSVLIFSLGVLLNLIGGNFEYLRLPGVLQRIAIVFFSCALLFIYTSRNIQIIVGVMLLLGYYLAMKFCYVPEVGRGVLEPGNNLAAWIDSKIIPFHMYQGSWDPEGILSSFPAIGTGILGMMAAQILLWKDKSRETKVFVLVIAGLSAVIVGLLWSLEFPINKNLWSSSYVLVTAGMAAILWALLIWIMDILDNQKWAYPSVVFGSNAITAYVLSYILLLPFNQIHMSNGETLQSGFMTVLISLGMVPELASVLWAISFTFLCFLPVLILYRKNIFIKI